MGPRVYITLKDGTLIVTDKKNVEIAEEGLFITIGNEGVLILTADIITQQDEGPVALQHWKLP